MSSNLTQLLSKIVSDSQLHAKWLNTLSFLEYIGFRKIVKSQQAEQLDLEILGHVVEEGRHALILKKSAQKIGGSSYSTYSSDFLLCGAQAESYFQSLDRICGYYLEIEPAHLKSRLVYLYVTWLIELRALDVYGKYQLVLADLGMNTPLKGLLSEEEVHLAAVKRDLLKLDPLFFTRSIALKAYEEALFQNFALVLSQTLLQLETRLDASV